MKLAPSGMKKIRTRVFELYSDDVHAACLVDDLLGKLKKIDITDDRKVWRVPIPPPVSTVPAESSPSIAEVEDYCVTLTRTKDDRWE
jgi:hypothetical protein